MAINRKSPHFNKGKRRDIALVFSCPGREEELNRKPVYGQTGINLEKVLKYLEKENPSIAAFKNRYDLRITNASRKVHYKKKTGRSEELDSQLFKKGNLSRLKKELLDIEKYVICFGKKAEKTVKRMLDDSKHTDLSFKPIYTRHLGAQSLNSMVVKISTTNKTEYKLKKLAHEISIAMRV